MSAAKQAHQASQAKQVNEIVLFPSPIRGEGRVRDRTTKPSTWLACLAWLVCFASAKAEDVSTPSLDMIRRTVNQSDAGEGWNFQFGPRWGMFLPANAVFRDTYGGSGFLYGMYVAGFDQDLGFRIEVEHIQGDRLLPLNATNVWRNIQSNISLTPFSVSGLLRIAPEPWMTYVGVGGVVMLASERFRGETYVGGTWNYTDFTNTDTLFGMQLILGITRGKRFGVELKYSFVPRRGSTGFADLGGLSTALSLSF